MTIIRRGERTVEADGRHCLDLRRQDEGYSNSILKAFEGERLVVQTEMRKKGERTV